jgi:cytochrome c-type biogenesis protein
VTGAIGAVGAASGPLLYAFTLGLVAAVNPCGFPLLGAYLSFFVGSDTEERPRRLLRGLAAGSCVTVGFVVVFAVLGGLVEGGVDVVLGWVPWVMIPVGVALAAIGVAGALGHPLKLLVPARRLGTGRGALAMAGFGVTYAVASLTCALPLFLAAVAGTFGRLGFARGLGSFVAYALGMGLFLMVAGLIVANAGVSALRRLRPFTRFVPRVAGGVLALVGAYLTYYWAAFQADPTASPPPIGFVEHVQSDITAWLSSSVRVVGVVLGLAVVVALLLAAGVGRRAPQAITPGPPEPAGREELIGG